MLQLNRKEVNVDRLALIEALKASRIAHAAQFAEADSDYKAAVKVYLTQALARVEAGDFKDVSIKIRPPVNHDSDYADTIEILQDSVDSNIKLDLDSYRAYYKNQWSWSNDFSASAIAYKSVAGLSAALGIAGAAS